MSGNGRYPAPDRPKLITYRCSHRHMTGGTGCKNKEIKRDDVERFVLEQLQKQLCNPQRIPYLTERLNQYISEQEDNSERVGSYQERVKELNKQRQNIIEAVTLSGLSETFSVKLAAIEQEIQSISNLLQQAEKSSHLTVITEEQVASYLHSFQDIVVNR